MKETPKLEQAARQIACANCEECAIGKSNPSPQPITCKRGWCDGCDRTADRIELLVNSEVQRAMQEISEFFGASDVSN